MSRGSWSPAPSPAPPLVGSRVRARAPLAPAHAGAAQQPGPVGPQPISRAAAAAPRARSPARRRRQGGSSTARCGGRRSLFLRAGAGVSPGGGGDADPQLCAPRTQPNGQVLHVLRAAAPSSHSPGERAHDARRPPGGSLKSHPVVGVALTPRYSPRPRLDNVRPAAAPPEEPAEPDPEPSSTPDPPEPAALRPPVSAAPAGPT